MYRTVSQFFGFYPKFIQGKKSHKNQTEKIKTKLRKIRQNPRKTLDVFALCSNKIQSQNYTFVIPLFLLIQKLYEKSAVSHAHRGLKKYTTFNYLSLLIRMSVEQMGGNGVILMILPEFCWFDMSVYTILHEFTRLNQITLQNLFNTFTQTKQI